MKKILLASAVSWALFSCNDNTSTNTEANDTNPSVTDSTQHPNGMSNGSVISTDTASMNVDNTNVRGLDSASNP